MIETVRNSEKGFCSEMVLMVGSVDSADGPRCRWYDLVIPAVSGYLIQVVVPGGKRYSYIRA